MSRGNAGDAALIGAAEDEATLADIEAQIHLGWPGQPPVTVE